MHIEYRVTRELNSNDEDSPMNYPQADFSTAEVWRLRSFSG